VVEWFWRNEALAGSRASLPGARVQLLRQRARTSADIATVALTAEPLDASVEAIACELYRQSTYWAASATLSDASPEASAPPDEALWDAIDDSLLADVAEAGETSQSLRGLLRTGSFVRFAELSAAEQKTARRTLSKISQAMLVRADEHTLRANEIRRQRVSRLAGLALVALGIVLAGSLVPTYLEHRGDLAIGKPWRASSRYSVGGCTSPEQDCPGAYFFHTVDDDPSPWVEFDLGAEMPVSRVQVDNRKDCCLERAVPLGVELSRDRDAWQTVAKRDEEFTSWRAVFAPVTARYVRLRVMRPGILHLSHVSIFP
jgi:hypothetical protein